MIKSKKIMNKLIVAIIFIFMLNFTFGSLGNNKVLADELEDGAGKFFLPIHNFVIYITDSVLKLMQNNFISQSPIILDAECTEYGYFNLPYIEYAPEKIFSNDIPLFNINFFEAIQATNKEYLVPTGVELIYDKVPTIENYLDTKYPNWTEQEEGLIYDYIEEAQLEINKLQMEIYNNYKKTMEHIGGKVIDAKTMWQDQMNDQILKYTVGSMDINLPVETIIQDSNKYIQNFNATIENYSNFIKDSYIYMYFSEGEMADLANKLPGFIKITEEIKEVEYKSSSEILQSSVSSIYKSLRILAIVAMLTILVYVGIRIVISSAAKDKAKYKQMLIDWLIAFIMLFVLHYLMAFIIDISEELTNICDKSDVSSVDLEVPYDTRVYYNEYEISSEEVNNRLIKSEDNAIWKTNFTGNIRYYAGLVQEKGYSIKGIGYTIMYIALVIEILVFTFQYLKRVIYMAFLTMIAPLVSITYPLDKINDGKAQGFSLWIKEYIFNALLQPIHYIIYVVIMKGVMDLVVDNVVYAVVALGFMVPAEKFIRKMFGFDKASTVGVFGGAAGAALLMGGIHKLARLGRGGSGNRQQNHKENETTTKTRSINMIEDEKTSKTMLDVENEKFGTSEWDAQYANALAADADGGAAWKEYMASHSQTEDEVMLELAKGSGFDSVEEYRKYLRRR